MRLIDDIRFGELSLGAPVGVASTYREEFGPKSVIFSFTQVLFNDSSTTSKSHAQRSAQSDGGQCEVANCEKFRSSISIQPWPHLKMCRRPPRLSARPLLILRKPSSRCYGETSYKPTYQSLYLFSLLYTAQDWTLEQLQLPFETHGVQSVEQASIFDKLQHIKPNNAALSTPRPAAATAAADDNRGDRPGIRGML